MIIPVWAASWELSCCQPEATVGGTWEVPVEFVPRADPWWVADWNAAATDAQRALGVVTLDLKRVRGRSGAETLAVSGPLRVRVREFPGEGVVSGRLAVDAHPDSQGIGPDEVTLRGVVHRVDLIPLRYERGKQAFVPVAQLESVGAHSTLDREMVDDRASRDGRSHIEAQLLIWLEVEASAGDERSVATNA